MVTIFTDLNFKFLFEPISNISFHSIDTFIFTDALEKFCFKVFGKLKIAQLLGVKPASPDQGKNGGPFSGIDHKIDRLIVIVPGIYNRPGELKRPPFPGESAIPFPPGVLLPSQLNKKKFPIPFFNFKKNSKPPPHSFWVGGKK